MGSILSRDDGSLLVFTVRHAQSQLPGKESCEI